MLTYQITENHLKLRNGAWEESLKWPGVTLKLDGVLYTPETSEFENEFFAMRITLEERHGVLFKRVEVQAKKLLPTVDYLEVDAQETSDDTLKRLGYVGSWSDVGRPNAPEEGGGNMSGCGYPVAGKHFFASLVHPAAFAEVTKPGAYRLYHHPAWGKDGALEVVEAVIGLADDAQSGLRELVEILRVPRLKKPLFAFCSFWSDPYVGDFDYQIESGN